MANAKAYISTVPFGTASSRPVEMLKKHGIDFKINPYDRTLTEEEIFQEVEDIDYLIAGVEPITARVLDRAKKLKLIARVGVGLDNIPFEETRKRGIKVTYTPNAVTRAVAELNIGLIIDSLRKISLVDRHMHAGVWDKYLGYMVQGKTIGIIGVGRIGKDVVRLLKPFNVRVLGYDVFEDVDFVNEVSYFSYTNLDTLLKESDIVCLCLSYSPAVRHFINRESLGKMKPSAMLINTARGPMVSEDDLYDALSNKKIAGAALDVFEKEPYKGKLAQLDSVIMTSHIAAATYESRTLMEVGAVEELLHYEKGEPLNFEIGC